MEKIKACNKCKRELPMNSDHYYNNIKSNDGLGRNCKECQGFSFTNKLNAKEGYKFCTKCGGEFPMTTKYFYRKNTARDGLVEQCKICRSKKRKKRYRDEKEKGIPQKHYNDNRMLYLISAMKARGYKELTEQNLIQITNNFKTENGYNVCPYCNREIKNKEDIQYDHLIPNKEGVNDALTNLIPVCSYCNRSKHGEDFIKWYRVQFFYNQDSEQQVLKYFTEEKLRPFFEKGHRGVVFEEK